MLFYFDSFLQILGSTFLDLFVNHFSRSLSRILIPISVDYQPLEVVLCSENYVVYFKPPDVEEVTLWGTVQEQLGSAVNRDAQKAIFRRCFQGDPGISGLYPVAVNKNALQSLTATYPRRRLSTDYVAIVRGLMEQPEIRIDAPIGRDLRFKSPIVRSCTSTDWEHCFTPCYCTTQVILVETGYFDGEFSSKIVLRSYRGDRKHQFRVHLKEVGHPLVGDTLYDDVGQPRSDHLMIQLLRVRAENLQMEIEDPYTTERLKRWRIKETFCHLQDALEKLDSLEAF